MFWIVHQIVLSVHILLGITWVGGILFVGWGVFPAAEKLDYISRQRFLISLMQGVHHLFTLVGSGVIVTGVLLGTVLGPVRQLDSMFHSAYGHNLLMAFTVGVLTLLWGVFVSYRFSMKVLTHQTLWRMAENGYPRLLKNAMRSVAIVSGVEVLGFLGLVAIMLSF
ncbi:hypothetical protein [Planococcus salinus]|uniref:Copper resistance protein D domain-containing protein n=1 Tax=Planococcus salinus TaxID=1848460 RepID=A0A3M8P9J4_9BACL|nr:hypothetical protein [Planococcus salinus]RNF40348.1 hypothetical protein EEX84_02660 [Planococcus salinus]